MFQYQNQVHDCDHRNLFDANEVNNKTLFAFSAYCSHYKYNPSDVDTWNITQLQNDHVYIRGSGMHEKVMLLHKFSNKIDKVSHILSP